MSTLILATRSSWLKDLHTVVEAQLFSFAQTTFCHAMGGRLLFLNVLVMFRICFIWDAPMWVAFCAIHVHLNFKPLFN